MELLEAAKAVLAILGDDDLADNGELSGAAITDALRAAVEQAEVPRTIRALRMVALMDSGECYHTLYGDPMPTEDFQDFLDRLALKGYWSAHVKVISIYLER